VDSAGEDDSVTRRIIAGYIVGLALCLAATAAVAQEDLAKQDSVSYMLHGRNCEVLYREAAQL
jgi:hypothetical protein